MLKFLLVDDDRELTDLLRYVFQRDGFTVHVAFDGSAALQLAELENPDLIILDLNLPQRSGIEVLKDLRGHSQVPVIVLTAIGDEDHLVGAFNLGADDYMVKPFRPRELMARVKAVLRRGRRGAGENWRETVSIRGVTLDPQTRQVTVGERSVHLTHLEFGLLHYLMLNRGIVVPIADIISNVWGYDAESDENIVRITISRLRRKLEADPSNPTFLVNAPGEGYLFPNRA